MPAVVVGPVVRHDAVAQGAQRMDVRLRRLPGRFRPVHVPQQFDPGVRHRDGDVVAVPVDQVQPARHAFTAAGPGAQPGAFPCRAL